MALIEPSQKLFDFRNAKAYSVTEAARLAKTSTANVRRWILGYVDKTGTMKPVFGQKEAQDGSLRLSFLELAEVVVASAFREKSVPLKRIRAAHFYARNKLGVTYPFASLKLLEQGGHILHEFDPAERGSGSLVVLDQHGQYALPLAVEASILLFDFATDATDKLALRWYPFGRKVPIVVDPEFGGGRPTIRGRGVTTDIITRRHRFGESVSSIADDFQLTREEVLTVLKFAA